MKDHSETTTETSTETSAPAPGARTLADAPDWGYLLLELRDIHRVSSSGGSEPVRRHHEQICRLLEDLLEANAPIRPAETGTPPDATAFLTRAINRAVRQPSQETIRAVRAVREDLAWHTQYDDLPEPMRGRFAQCEIVSPQGPVVSPDLMLGLMLFAPGCRYPEHWHEGIEESYLTLSGSLSENDGGVWAPGSLILNPAERVHRLNVGGREPGLVAYAWLGGRDSLARPVTRFAGPEG